MPATLGKIGVHCMAGGLVLAAFLAPASAGMKKETAADGAFDFTGRWEQVAFERGHSMRLGTLDISACGEGYCGRLVEAGGACGAVAMRLEVDGDPHDRLMGSYTEADGRDFDVVFRPADGSADELELSALEDTSFVSRSSMPLGASFERSGPTRCGRAPVS